MNRMRTGIGAAAAMLLVACGGSTLVAGIEGSGSPAPAAAAVGPITGFGSIFVNGVEYVTSSAQILIDNQPGTEAQLHAGQIVTIQGSVNADGTTGTATAVSFSGNVQGPVTSIDLVANTFVVLGQTVRVTGSTLFDENLQATDLTGLQAGTTLVEVSGFTDATGEIVASRIDLKSAGGGLQVEGVIQGLDTTAHTFSINALVVDYSAATGTAPANGSAVEVQGTTLTSAGALLATHLEVLPTLGATANERADLEGIITSFTSTASFVLQGQQVTTDANTQFVLHGITLGQNVEVDVDGTFNASGMLLAKKVEVRPQSASLVRGLVDSVNAANNTLSVLGVNVTTSASTEFDDKSKQHVRLFRLTDLNAGDYVEINGTENPPGTLSASILERDNAENRSYLVGTALNVAEPNFTVLGVTVTTNAQTHFAGPGGSANGAATFFSQAANHVVNVRGTFSAGVLTADRVQIEQ